MLVGLQKFWITLILLKRILLKKYDRFKLMKSIRAGESSESIAIFSTFFNLHPVAIKEEEQLVITMR